MTDEIDLTPTRKSPVLPTATIALPWPYAVDLANILRGRLVELDRVEATETRKAALRVLYTVVAEAIGR